MLMHRTTKGLELTTIVEDLPELGYILKGASPRAAPQNHHIFHLCAGIVSLFLFQVRSSLVLFIWYSSLWQSLSVAYLDVIETHISV